MVLFNKRQMYYGGVEMYKQDKIIKNTCKFIIGIIFIVLIFKSLPIVFYSDGRVHFEPYNISYSEYFKLYTNIIPFNSFVDYKNLIEANRINTDIVIRNVVVNIIVFVPIGCLLGLIFDGNFKKTTCAAAAIAIILEIVQIISKSGACDVDDVILRMVGSFLGYLIPLLIIKLTIKREKK